MGYHFKYFAHGWKNICPFCGKSHFLFVPITHYEAHKGRKYVQWAITANCGVARLETDLGTFKGQIEYTSPGLITPIFAPLEERQN